MKKKSTITVLLLVSLSLIPLILTELSVLLGWIMTNHVYPTSLVSFHKVFWSFDMAVLIPCSSVLILAFLLTREYVFLPLTSKTSSPDVHLDDHEEGLHY